MRSSQTVPFSTSVELRAIFGAQFNTGGFLLEEMEKEKL
jgi:hypothetical protein